MWTSTTTRPFGRKAKFSQREMNIGSSGQRTWETSGGALWAPFVFLGCRFSTRSRAGRDVIICAGDECRVKQDPSADVRAGELLARRNWCGQTDAYILSPLVCVCALLNASQLQSIHNGERHGPILMQNSVYWVDIEKRCGRKKRRRRSRVGALFEEEKEISGDEDDDGTLPDPTKPHYHFNSKYALRGSAVWRRRESLWPRWEKKKRTRSNHDNGLVCAITASSQRTDDDGRDCAVIAWKMCHNPPQRREREREKEKTLLSPYCGVTFDRLCLKVFWHGLSRRVDSASVTQFLPSKKQKRFSPHPKNVPAVRKSFSFMLSCYCSGTWAAQEKLATNGAAARHRPFCLF